MSRRMYAENRKSINWFVGCGHNCVYCKPSFQRQAKRSRKHCQKHYDYEPHAHLEKLEKPPPLTLGDEFIFFPSLGDPCFATPDEFKLMLGYVKVWSDRTFLIQSKNPAFFLDYQFPDNVILGTTIETDQTYFHTPSKYLYYQQISKAPLCSVRWNAMIKLQHKRKLVTVEPILDFDGVLLPAWLRQINPEIIYVGYDNHGCELPEPPLWKTKLLIKDLEEIAEVRIKTLREAWWES